jgi:filamentous hemagglutinin
LKIYLVAFRGLGNDPENQEPGLVKLGHVGIQFEDDPRIFGFSPLISMQDEEILISNLKNHQPQPGTVKDDTAIFERVEALFENGERTEVIYTVWDNLSQDNYLQMKQQVLSWYNTQEIIGSYNLPQDGGGFGENEYNCATFPSLLGLPIPSYSGLIKDYIRLMRNQGAQRWQPPSNRLSE